MFKLNNYLSTIMTLGIIVLVWTKIALEMRESYLFILFFCLLTNWWLYFADVRSNYHLYHITFGHCSTFYCETATPKFRGLKHFVHDIVGQEF